MHPRPEASHSFPYCFRTTDYRFRADYRGRCWIVTVYCCCFRAAHCYRFGPSTITVRGSEPSAAVPDPPMPLSITLPPLALPFPRRLLSPFPSRLPSPFLNCLPLPPRIVYCYSCHRRTLPSPTVTEPSTVAVATTVTVAVSESHHHSIPNPDSVPVPDPTPVPAPVVLM